ncbi:MAG: hypothetical protein QM638_00275 [Nocardioides sp.]|uniref:hypothetical protein n=1 Tax=Nocardioides sp. TaxID=35761 RepID=UPI0039E58657
MSWLALLLAGLGLADLGHSLRPVRLLPETVAAVLTVALGLLAGLTAAGDVVALLVIAAIVIGWGVLVRQGFGRGRPQWPLALLVLALAAALLLAPLAGEGGGPVGDWLDASPWWSGVDPDRALLVFGALLVQLSTGNVVVRLVLAVTGTINPARPSHDASVRLKGGRLLGPMERLVLVGLGLAGQLTAASLVIAAKGLLRWPELQSFRTATEGPTIDEVTEYFLLGSFLSWSVSLATLALLVHR